MNTTATTLVPLSQQPEPAPNDLPATIDKMGREVESYVAECDNIDDAAELRRRWTVFAKYANTHTRKGRRRLEATERLIELRMGQLIIDTGIKHVDVQKRYGLGNRDVYEFTSMAKHDEVVRLVIDASTNQEPATRNRVFLAIRAHREAIGDLKRYNRTTAPHKSKKWQMAYEREQLAKAAAQSNPDLSVVYQRVRQALATVDAIQHANTGSLSRDCLWKLHDHLVGAEALTVDLLNQERAACSA